MDPKEKQKLEDLIELLGSIKGRHTELVSVLIPAGYNINSVTRQLEGEKSTASNIKSSATRKNVTAALDMIIRELKGMKVTPEKGLAIFCGNISRKEGDSDIQLWVHEPPKELKVKTYRCDQEFVLEPLMEMVGVEEVYGLLVIDRQQATIGLLEGSNIKVLQKLTSGVPGKIRAGGQCLHPDTLVETKSGKKEISKVEVGEELKAYDMEGEKIVYTRCVNKWNKRKDNHFEVIYEMGQLICSGDHVFFVPVPEKSEKKGGTTKYSWGDKMSFEERAAENLTSEDLLFDGQMDREVHEVKPINTEIDLIDIEAEQGNFFANDVLVHNSSQRFHRITEGLAKEFFRRVADEMKKIFFDMPKLKGLLVGGPIPTKEEFLEEGNLVTKLKEKVISVKDLGYVDEHGLELLVEESQGDLAEQELIKEKKFVQKFFETLGKDKKLATYGVKNVKTALERGAVAMLLISKDFDRDEAKELEAMAEQIDSEVVMIGTDHTDGEQFFNLTKGVGAVLRFAYE